MKAPGLIAAALLAIISKVLLDLLSRQVQGWLFGCCFAVLRLARRRLPVELRESVHDETCVPELHYILYVRYGQQPITAMVKGYRYAIGEVLGARRVALAAGVNPALRHNAVSSSAINEVHASLHGHGYTYSWMA